MMFEMTYLLRIIIRLINIEQTHTITNECKSCLNMRKEKPNFRVTKYVTLMRTRVSTTTSAEKRKENYVNCITCRVTNDYLVIRI